MATKKQGSKLPVKTLVTGVSVILVIFAVVAAGWGFLVTSDYFKVREIVVSGGDASKLEYLHGKNMFFLDLDREAERLLSQCTECSRVAISKILPGRLFVQFVHRNPIALVKSSRGYYSLDEDGTLFNSLRKPEEMRLPVIIGLERRLNAVAPGRRYRSNELALAIDILRIARLSRALIGYDAKTLFVGDMVNASLIMTPAGMQLPPIDKSGVKNIEIKLGPDSIKDKFSILDNLIAQTKVDIASIKYVDMRFKDPVMKMVDDKPAKKP